MRDIYIPDMAEIEDIKIETRDVKTFKLVFQSKEIRSNFSFSAGQFIEFSVPRIGESPFCVASAPSDRGYIECSVKKIGKVTDAIHMLEVGDIIGIRGPFGNCFPIEEMKGRNLIFIGGGIGLVPLRSLIREVFSMRNEFKDIFIIYGARSFNDLVYKDELDEWETRGDIKTFLTLDPGGETEDWKGEVGLVPDLLKKTALLKDNSIVFTCGPPVMIKLSLITLEELGFSPSQVITTLEMRMKCGIGKCGRCNVGPLYVCKDGPIFTYEQIKGFVEDIF
ncbi:MAG: FAD/NAD(P)-binding protein [Spirochaetota bacterium]|nr:MAG: FAD/NAD(P)-binding protein [Spirochaetota bacterium]